MASTSPISTGARFGERESALQHYPAGGNHQPRRSGITVSYAQGDGASVPAAVQLATNSDVAIVCVGQQTSEGSDRSNLSLPNGQDALISAVAAANPHTIVVMYESSATLMPWANQVAGSADGVVSGTGKWQRAGSSPVRGRKPFGKTTG